MKLKKIINLFIPRFFEKLCAYLEPQAYNIDSQGEFHCPICDNQIQAFLKLDDFYFEQWDKHQFIHSIFCFETFNLRQYTCPNCGANDRNRLFSLYLKPVFNRWVLTGKSYLILDIAPDNVLRDWIRATTAFKYRSVDLYRNDVDDTADITDMKLYSENMFDCIICSHVIEHIKDDEKALKEIHRILKPDGFAIIMAPILLSLTEDFENEKYTTDELRWKYFGQNDHIRCYSKQGFINKLKKTGFCVHQLDVNYFSQDSFQIAGISNRSVLYLVNKVDSSSI